LNGERTEKAPPPPPAASAAGTISEFPFASGSYSDTPSALLTLNNFNFGSTMIFNTELSSTDLATFSFTNGGIASSSWDGFTGPNQRVAESRGSSLISAPSTSWG